MIRWSPILRIPVLVIAIGGLTAALVWGNYQFTISNPGGEHFLVDWFSARSLFIDGINPYSETARTNLYAFAQNEADIALETGSRFDVPLYSAFVTLPFALIRDFEVARALWMTVLEGLLVTVVFIGTSLARWKIKPVPLGLLILFSVFWFHGLYPVVSGSMIVVVSLILASVFLAVRARQYEFAGVLLGLATIQPNATVLFAIFVLYWSFRYRHAKIAIWFFASILLLSATAALIRPQWIMDYLRVLFQPATTVQTINQVFQSFLPAAGGRIGALLSGITGLILIFEWFVSKKADFEGFYWTGLLTLTLTPWIGLPTEPVLFIVSMPAIIFAIFLWHERWPRVSPILTGVVVILLFGGIWGIYFTQAGQPVSSNPGLYFAQPLIVTIMLFWVRWWAIRKPNVWFDQLSKG